MFRVSCIQTVVVNGISEPSTLADNWQRGTPQKEIFIFQALIFRGQNCLLVLREGIMEGVIRLYPMYSSFDVTI